MSFDFLNWPQKKNAEFLGFPNYNQANQSLERGFFGFPSYSVSNLQLLVYGSAFPYVSGGSANGGFVFTFSAPCVMTVNWGDGITLNYTTNTSNEIRFYLSGGGVQQYIYNYSASGAYTITFSFPSALLTSFNLGGDLTNVAQTLNWDYSKLTSLTSISIVPNSANIDPNFPNLLGGGSKITYISLRANLPIPLQMLYNCPLTTLIWNSSSFSSSGSTTFADSNLDKVSYLKNTLQTLQIQTVNDTSNGGQGIPATFGDLNIQTLNLPFANFSTPPSNLNYIVSLTTLNMDYNNLTSWGTFSNLINLTSISFRGNGAVLPTSVPSWLISLVNLKTLTLRGYGRLASNPQTNMDTFIGNIYSFIISNASITDDGVNYFRKMNIDVRVESTGDGTAIPSGTLQAPSGFVQGSTNGSPASSLEMIYVLINQYQHSWAYRAV